MLSLKEEGKTVEVDSEWETRFFSRLKARMSEHGVLEEQLTNKFRFYDRQDSGFIEQTDFKTVLSELGVSVSLA